MLSERDPRVTFGSFIIAIVFFVFIFVRGRGLEPPRVLPHRILNPARLPVPPPALNQSRNQKSNNVVIENKRATAAVILLKFLSASV